jgi:hypothetical protein
MKKRQLARVCRFFYFFQKAGKNSINIVNSSKRPISITIESTHFAKSGNIAYVPTGPNCPNAGPTFAIDASEHPKASLGDTPHTIRIIVDNIVIIRNIDKKTYVFDKVFSDIIRLFTLTGLIAFGCITRLNS